MAAHLSTANFTAILEWADAASNEYKTFTKQDLEAHPFAAPFENSNSPDSVMDVFRKSKASPSLLTLLKGDDKLMTWVDPHRKYPLHVFRNLRRRYRSRKHFWYWRSSRGQSIPTSLCFRAHPILPSTSSSLHSSSTHAGGDGTTHENHGLDSVYSCPLALPLTVSAYGTNDGPRCNSPNCCTRAN